MTRAIRTLLPTALAVALAWTPALRAQASATPDPLLPDSVLAPPGSPRVIRLPAPTEGVVSLRLSIPLSESPAEAGAGRMLAMLAQRRLEGPASALGARVEAGRTPWGLVYTVTGPVADLDYLTYLLRVAAREPSPDVGTLEAVRAELDERLRRLEETGGGRIEAELRAAATPEKPPIDGTRGSLPTLGVATLRDVWARSHRPEAMTLLVAGQVADPVLLASLAGLGSNESSPAPPSGAPAPPSPRPGRVQTLRRWVGAAWSTSAPLDPRAAVAAVLLARRLRDEQDDYEAEIRLWETSDRTVLAAVGAAYPRQAAALQRRIDGLIQDATSNLQPGEAQSVAERIRRDLLLQARTPWGRVHLVGRFIDAGLAIDAARRYLDALTDLDDDAMRAFLQDLSAGQTFRAQVRP